MNVTFEDITYSNIMSVGAKPITVKLDQAKKTLITGHNGAGKSTMLEALCFLLYGRPFRNIKKTQLVNSINKKGLLVEGHFSVGSNRFYVKRGIKPNILEIYKNDEKVPELASVTAFQEYFESDLLGISFESFKQVIVLGTAGYTPFMELTAGERRSLVEDLLDLTILGEMEKNNKGMVKVAKQNYDMVKVKIDANRAEQSVVLESYDSQEKALKEQRQEIIDEINRIIPHVNEQKATITELESELSSMVAPSEKDLNLEIETLRNSVDISGLTGKIEALSSKLHTDHDVAERIKQESDSIRVVVNRLSSEIDVLVKTRPTEDDIKECVLGIEIPVAPTIEKPADVVYPENVPDESRVKVLTKQIEATQDELSELRVTHTVYVKQRDFVMSGGECPTCGTIHDAGTGHVSELDAKVHDSQLAIDSCMEKLNGVVFERNQLAIDIQNYHSECTRLDTKYRDELIQYERITSDYADSMRQYDRDVKSARDEILSRIREIDTKMEGLTSQLNLMTTELKKVDTTVRRECELENENILSQIESIRMEIKGIEQKLESDVESVRTRYENEVGTFESRKAAIKDRIAYIGEQVQIQVKTVKDKKKRADELLVKIDEIDTSSIDRLRDSLTELLAEQVRLYEELAARDVISVMLKDSGIKAHVVRQYIPVFNKRINSYLQTMGADYVFTLDETFNESIKSRGREDFSYTSFSQGERARINVALLFTWRDIASIVSGVNINLLVLDELFDSATDAEGVKAINTLLDKTGSNVFVISHRAENMNDSFDRHLKMVKRGRFTVQE